MTDLPHLILRVDAEVDGHPSQGIAADGLPPKWFTKNPETSFQQDDLPAMLRSIRSATESAVATGEQPTVFDWWWETYRSQMEWAREHQVPPLLAGLGSSLLERAAIDAFCRARNCPFEIASRNGSMGIQLGRVRPELSSLDPIDVLPKKACRSLVVRHTVGLGDPLTDDDLPASEQVNDGLPQTLRDSIRKYGLRYFKIKLSGRAADDRQRLISLQQLLSREVGAPMRFTLDANEQYQNLNAFREIWEQLRSISQIREMFDRHLLFVEQPLHRDIALADSVGEELRDWSDAPPIIIDESDGDLGSFPRAVTLGYRGTSHKNCKGIFKGLVTAATIHSLDPDRQSLIFSAEDLGNVGPVALLQDLAVVASLGITHVERNGHHYFRGLSMFPSQIQQSLLAHHGDLYHQHASGFATLTIRDGSLDVGSVVEAPFGLAKLPDWEWMERWDF